MSKKQTNEPVRPDEGQVSPLLPLALLVVLGLAVIALALKAFGIF